jgi:hypothetical protein
VESVGAAEAMECVEEVRYGVVSKGRGEVSKGLYE